ncbi:MAG TPA: tetratricopeptide repeat protein [Gemmatimonadales bacterium]|nr:tetratricopeptide repeat protein [Gemmatimonadales bacterium]
MPKARRRRQSARQRVHDELFGPAAARGVRPPDAAGAEADPEPEAPHPAPPEPEAARLYRLARDAEQEGRLEDALRLYEQLLATDPLHLDGRIALARLLELLDRPEAALALLDHAIRELPDRTELLVVRGGAYARLRRYAEAEGDLRRVVRLHPSHGPAHFELGLILLRRGLAAEAADAFARAAAHGAAGAPVYTHLAEALNQSGRLDEAVAALHRSLELDPLQARAYHLLGRVLDRLQRSDQATAMYRRARELADR